MSSHVLCSASFFESKKIIVESPLYCNLAWVDSGLIHQTGIIIYYMLHVHYEEWHRMKWDFDSDRSIDDCQFSGC